MFLSPTSSSPVFSFCSFCSPFGHPQSSPPKRFFKFGIRISSSIDRRKKQTEQRQVSMEMKRNLQVEKKTEEEENICTALFTAVVVLSMACLKHFYSVSYLIEQWRSLVFLLLNVVLLSVYFTSTRPSSKETTHDFKIRRGCRLRTMKKKKKKKTMMVEEQKDAEPKEVIKNCVVEETKMLDEKAKDCLFKKKSVDFNVEEDEFEPGRLSNEELNERVESFIKTFRQQLVLDARRGIDRESDNQEMKSNNSHLRYLAREVTCSV